MVAFPNQGVITVDINYSTDNTSETLKICNNYALIREGDQRLQQGRRGFTKLTLHTAPYSVWAVSPSRTVLHCTVQYQER